MSSMGLPAVLSGGLDFRSTRSVTVRSGLDRSGRDDRGPHRRPAAASRRTSSAYPSPATRWCTTRRRSPSTIHWRAHLRPLVRPVIAALSEWALPAGTTLELNRDAYVRPARSNRPSPDRSSSPPASLTADEVRIQSSVSTSPHHPRPYRQEYCNERPAAGRHGAVPNGRREVGAVSYSETHRHPRRRPVRHRRRHRRTGRLRVHRTVRPWRLRRHPDRAPATSTPTATTTAPGRSARPTSCIRHVREGLVADIKIVAHRSATKPWPSPTTACCTRRSVRGLPGRHRIHRPWPPTHDQDGPSSITSLSSPNRPTPRPTCSPSGPSPVVAGLPSPTPLLDEILAGWADDDLRSRFNVIDG